ncbi:unnamed protein product [Brassica oleracea var. botrytis]|nr:unnamed protein product [Brassica napus]
MVALVSTSKTRTKLTSEEDAAIIPEGCAATAATPKECPVLNAQKRLAASVMKCGKGKVWLDPSESKDISMANSRSLEKERSLKERVWAVRIEQGGSQDSSPENTTRFRVFDLLRSIQWAVLSVLTEYFCMLMPPFAMQKFSRVFKDSRVWVFQRHSGYGKKKGTREVRQPTKVLWMNRLRVLRRFLLNYREKNKIDKHMYHDMYKKVKGGVFKNKRVLMESIHKSKVEQAREKTLSGQFEAKRVKNKARKERKFARKKERLARGAGGGEIAVVS